MYWNVLGSTRATKDIYMFDCVPKPRRDPSNPIGVKMNVISVYAIFKLVKHKVSHIDAFTNS